MHINPDHFLATEHGRVVTPERNSVAWEKCYRVLAEELARQGQRAKVLVLIGPQGAGKSSWARDHAACNPAAIIFDAILVKRIERVPILQDVREHAGMAVAVWFDTALDVCIARNAARPVDERVPEQAIRNVHTALEPPTLEEGFGEILVVPGMQLPCEISIASALGKLEADPDEVLAGIEPAGFNHLSIVGGHAAKVANLPPIHKDPFDRLLVAQARFEPMILLTDDDVLGGYGDFVEVI